MTFFLLKKIIITLINQNLCENVMKKNGLFESDEYICSLRTIAVLIKNNKILVQREKIACCIVTKISKNIMCVDIS